MSIDYNDLFYQFVKKYSKEYKEKGTIEPEEMGKVFKEFREIEEQFYKDKLYDFPENFQVDGKELLNELMEAIRKYIYLPDLTGSLIISLWILHTYLFEIFDCSPYLAIVSPVKRAGKTRLMTLISHLANNPLYASNLTPASIYRIVEEQKPTLLIDEFDSMWNDKSESGEAFRGILNAGHLQNQSFVLRIANNGKVEKFQTFSPKAIAMIGNLPGTVQDRSIAITMQRKPPSVKLPRLPLDWKVFFSLKQKIIFWTLTHKEEIKKAYETVDIDLENDRARDNFLPLLAICYAISPEVAEALKKAIMQRQEPETETLIELLRDIKTVFEEKGTEKVFTSELIEGLCKNEESRWLTYNYGKPITPRQLSLLLKPLGIRPIHLRIKDETGKGYTLEMFKDAFLAYLPSDLRLTRLTELTNDSRSQSTELTNQKNVNLANPLQKPSVNLVNDVNDKTGDVEGIQSYLPSTPYLSSTNSTNDSRSQSEALQVSKGVEDGNPLQKPNVEDVEDVEDKTGGVEDKARDVEVCGNFDILDLDFKIPEFPDITLLTNSKIKENPITDGIKEPDNQSEANKETLTSFKQFLNLLPPHEKKRDPEELWITFKELENYPIAVVREGIKRNENYKACLELTVAFCKDWLKRGLMQ